MSTRAVKDAVRGSGYSIDATEAEAINAAAGKNLSRAEIKAVTDILTGVSPVKLEEGAAAVFGKMLMKPTEGSYIVSKTKTGALIGAVPAVAMAAVALSWPQMAMAVPQTLLQGATLGAGVGALYGWATSD